MAIPQLSSAQLEAAREAATQARRARAELKEQVKTGAVSFTDALNKARASEIMENLQIAPNRRIRGLGRHQVDRLNELFK